MMNLAYLAWRQMAWHWGRASLVVTALVLMIFAPLASHLVLEAATTEWGRRAESTPLVLGSRGSRSDLVLHALYFTPTAESGLRMGDLEPINESGHGMAVPMHARHRAGGFPVVGTTLDYLEQRGLRLATGRNFALLGECVVGHEVARRMGVGVGDRLASDPENAFDLAGGDPLRMTVVGVLERRGTPEDRAILVDVKTSWVISGIGHGHDEPEPADIVATREGTRQASGALGLFQEITGENIDSFHFHEAPESLPLTAALVFPVGERGAAILRGRYDSPRSPLQLVVPVTVMDDLVEQVLRRKRVLNLFLGILCGAMAILLGTVLLLSLRLRRREFEVLETIGCSRGRRSLLVLMEWGLHLVVAFVLCSVLLVALSRVTPSVILHLL